MEPKIVNLFDADTDPDYNGPIFSPGSPDLNCNCLRLDGGEGVPLHVNAEVGVVRVVLEGWGFLQVDGQQHLLTDGDFFYIPRGTARKLRSAGGRFTSLIFHPRRPSLMPEG